MEVQVILEKTTIFLQRYVGGKELDPNEEIFSSGLVNSLFAMQLVLFLEKEFQVKVEGADLDLKNFSTLQAIAEFVKNKKREVLT